MLLWLDSKLSAGKLVKLLPGDLEYLVTYLSDKGKKKSKNSDTTKTHLPPINGECLIWS